MADNEMASLAVEECHEKMGKAVEHVKSDFGAVRTGRRALVNWPGRSAPMDAIELLGLAL